MNGQQQADPYTALTEALLLHLLMYLHILSRFKHADLEEEEEEEEERKEEDEAEGAERQ